MLKFILYALIIFTANIAHAGQCTVKKIENFYDFYSRFSTDKVFSMQRTIYPLKNKLWSPDDKTDVAIFKENYTTLEEDKIQPNLLKYLRENHLESEFKKVTEKEYLVEVYKPDTDWLLYFHFQRTGNCWYLYETEDFSL